jgi:hypothetical protein
MTNLDSPIGLHLLFIGLNFLLVSKFKVEMANLSITL